ERSRHRDVRLDPQALQGRDDGAALGQRVGERLAALRDRPGDADRLAVSLEGEGVRDPVGAEAPHRSEVLEPAARLEADGLVVEARRGVRPRREPVPLSQLLDEEAVELFRAVALVEEGLRVRRRDALDEPDRAGAALVDGELQALLVAPERQRERRERRDRESAQRTIPPHRAAVAVASVELLAVFAATFLMTRSGHFAWRVTCSATDPKNQRAAPERPWVVMAMRSTFSRSTSSRMFVAASPRVTIRRTGMS